MKRAALVAVLLTLGLVGGTVAAVQATHQSASCVGGPITHAGSDSEFDVHCTVPNTQTTVTATVTETVFPPTERTQFGASASGTSATAQQGVVDKFGPTSVSVRQFATSFTTVAPRLAGVSIVHYSWKPTSVAAITDTAVRNAVVNLKPGDMVEIWHEADKKVRDGVFSMTEAIARKNAFYEAVKRVRPDLLVANTLTGWEADPDNPTTRGNIDKWAQVKADVLGIDQDGANSWPYPDFKDEVPVVKKFVADFEPYKKWTVPEFGAPARPEDPNDTVLASWMRDHATYFRDNGAYAVMWFDYFAANNYILDSPAELDAWRDMVETNDG
jgi:hypothetical protein